jgi:hypothetical protein
MVLPRVICSNEPACYRQGVACIFQLNCETVTSMGFDLTAACILYSETDLPYENTIPSIHEIRSLALASFVGFSPSRLMLDA